MAAKAKKYESNPTSFRFSDENLRALDALVAYGRFAGYTEAIVSIAQNMSEVIKFVPYQIPNPERVVTLIDPIQVTFDTLDRIHGNMERAYLHSRLKATNATFLAVSKTLQEVKAVHDEAQEWATLASLDYQLNSKNHGPIRYVLRVWRKSVQPGSPEMAAIDALQMATGGIEPPMPKLPPNLEGLFAESRIYRITFLPIDDDKVRKMTGSHTEVNERLEKYRLEIYKAQLTKKLTDSHASLNGLHELIKDLPLKCRLLLYSARELLQFQIPQNTIEASQTRITTFLKDAEAQLVKAEERFTQDQIDAGKARIFAARVLDFYTRELTNYGDQEEQLHQERYLGINEWKRERKKAPRPGI